MILEREMPKTVLSIDIDACFNGHTYAKYMNYDLSPELGWKIVDLIASEVSDIDLEPDVEAITIIQNILRLKAQGAVIRVIDEHDEIVDVMAEYRDEHFNDFDKLDVYNIDAHHDLTYGNDDSELNIENWALHAKSKGLLGEYNWLHRPLSDIRVNSPISYKRDCLHDINPELMPEIGLVVLCVSKHFTPMKYWKSIINILLEEFPIGSYYEVHKDTLTESMIRSVNRFEDYLIDDSMPDTNRLFRCGKSFVVYEEYQNAVSMISLDGKGNLFGMKNVVDYLLDEYEKIRFDYKVGIRNEVYIKRLVKNYNIVDSGEGYYIIEKR